MKRRILYTFVTIFAMISCADDLIAQEVDMMRYNRDVNGVEIGTALTKEARL